MVFAVVRLPSRSPRDEEDAGRDVDVTSKGGAKDISFWMTAAMKSSGWHG